MDIYFEPDVVDLTDGEVKTVKLVINVDENAPANLYDVQIVGTWKEEGKIPDFMGSSIRLHVGHDFGDGKIPVNMLEPPLKFWKLIQNDGGMVDDVPCRNDYVLVVKHDGSPACVTLETKIKLVERGWDKFRANSDNETLTFSEGQSWGYIKDMSILDNDYVAMTMSYPTNEAHHKIYPDEHQSIVGDCTQQNNSASLSLLYFKYSDAEQHKITFTKKNKTFDGLQCDDVFWQEISLWGYCGPPNTLMHRTQNITSSISDAQKNADFVFDVPKYLPDGYSIQKIAVEPDGEGVLMYVSQKSVTHEVSGCEFTWKDEGILLHYSQPSESHDTPSGYLNVGDPRKQKVTINGNTGYVVDRWVGDGFGMPIPQHSKVLFYMQEENQIIQIRSSLAADKLIRIAESISNPIFNSDIIPDYSGITSQAKNNSNDEENTIPVKITGKTSKQICNKVRMECDNGHFFSATHNLYADTTILEQSVSYNNYVLEISNREICYRINGDPSDYCSFLNVDYSSILDGNKSTMLSQPLDFWKNLPREEMSALHEEYGDLFFEEIGKMVLKDNLKKEFEKQNIVNANNDFRLHTGMVDESLPPFVYYTTVVNSTDGKSYMFGGRTHTNQVLDVYHEELIFYDDVSVKLPIDSFRNDLPIIVIRPENESDVNSPKLFMNFDKNREVTFVNSMSLPIRIQDKGSGNPEKEHELAWIGPMMNPNDIWRIQINATGYHEWNAKIVPKESDGWWKPLENGDIIAYSENMSDVDFHKKLRIAGEFVMDSEIPVTGIGMGNNEGLRIGFSQAIIEMLPDAQRYYTERVKQVIPFDVPIILWN